MLSPVAIYFLSLKLTNLQSWVLDLQLGGSRHYERSLDIDQSDSALELIKSTYLHITNKLKNRENGKTAEVFGCFYLLDPFLPLK